MNLCRSAALFLTLGLAGIAHADDDELLAKYLANAGVLITHGETRIVFDPLFDEDFGTYERVPKDIEQALFAGQPPFDGLDAVFVSHHHGDHFSPARMAALLQRHPEVNFFGPSQAIDALSKEGEFGARLHEVRLELDGTFKKTIGEVAVTAVRIPHSGWPNRHADIENIVFRVSLNSAATVVHMGDAHTDPAFFAQRAEYWAADDPELALPPYWMFLSAGGNSILDDHIRAGVTIGVHVPKSMPDSPLKYPDELRDRTLFSVPGEERRIPVSAEAE